MLLLCVDDDPDDVELLCEAVKTIDQRHICVVARNGGEALKLLETLRPDAIILDVNMPVMDGKETLRFIRKDNDFDDVPVYMLSTTTNPLEMKSYKKMGASACFTKPNSFQALCQTLTPLLKRAV